MHGAATLEPNTSTFRWSRMAGSSAASFNYEIWRNLLLTLDYQYTNLRANVPFDSFVDQQGHCWCYLEILNGAVLIEAEKRTGMKQPRG